MVPLKGCSRDANLSIGSTMATLKQFYGILKMNLYSSSLLVSWVVDHVVTSRTNVLL